jgi:hypothetical protein
MLFASTELVARIERAEVELMVSSVESVPPVRLPARTDVYRPSRAHGRTPMLDGNPRFHCKEMTHGYAG